MVSSGAVPDLEERRWVGVASWWRGGCLVAIVAAAGLLWSWPWFRPHALTAVWEYDDGVYYGASRALLHGLLPYRDFTIVHPPLIAVILLPCAGLGHLFGDPAGMAVARILTVAAGLVDVCLVYFLALHQYGRTARALALAAAALYAFFPATFVADHTVLLEPWTNLACLAAMLLLSRDGELSQRAAFGAGLLLSAGLSIKLFAAAYLVVAVLWLAVARRERAGQLAAGIAVGVGVLDGPFALAAGSRFWHDVFVAQVTRPLDGNNYVSHRLTALMETRTLPLGLALALACILTVLVAAAALRRGRGPWAPLTLLIVVALLASPSYFEHYDAFLAAPLALALVGLVPRLRQAPRRAGEVLLAMAFSLWAVASVGDASTARPWSDLRVLALDIPRGACVFTDSTSLAVAAAVRFDPRQCPSSVDGRGRLLTLTHGWPRSREFYPLGFLENPTWQRETLAQLQGASVLLTSSDPTHLPEWTATLRRYVVGHFARRPLPGAVAAVELWSRTSR
ncbi:hypothetical protein acdb102_38250 [Acidothermaceae bacterium B102]|nr:hypothetical protein acdb102_38250 [Acidothermaceae bacterium B102]